MYTAGVECRAAGVKPNKPMPSMPKSSNPLPLILNPPDTTSHMKYRQYIIIGHILCLLNGPGAAIGREATVRYRWIQNYHAGGTRDQSRVSGLGCLRFRVLISNLEVFSDTPCIRLAFGGLKFPPSDLSRSLGSLTGVILIIFGITKGRVIRVTKKITRVLDSGSFHTDLACYDFPQRFFS